MPTDFLHFPSNNATFGRHPWDSFPQGERRGSVPGDKELCSSPRYQRVGRVIQADRHRAAQACRPNDRCAFVDTIAEHHIQTVASYLTPRDRMSLRHASKHFRHALRADAAIDRLTIKIDKVVTPSLLRRALAEIDRLAPARPSLIALLPQRVQLFCPPHCGPALELILDTIERLPVQQRVQPLASIGPLLRHRKYAQDAELGEKRVMEEMATAAVQRLPAALRGRPLAAVLLAGPTDQSQWGATGRRLVGELHAFPPDERALMLVTLAEQFDHLTGMTDEGLWRMMVDAALGLPGEWQPGPLRALASHPGKELRSFVQRWDHLMQIGLALSERSQAAVYAGLANGLMRLPGIVACDAGAGQRVDTLHGAIAALSLDNQLPALEAFARETLGAGLDNYWGKIVARVESLPAERRLGPLRALARGVWSAWRYDFRPFCPTLLEAARHIPPEDRAILLGDFAQRGGTLGELDELLDACLDLPLALRRWTLAGLAAKPFWVFADNARPIAQILLPMIESMDASHRVPILTSLLETAFNIEGACSRDVPTRHMPAATWRALEDSFDKLPPEYREQVLLALAPSIRDPLTPAWNWVLQATRKLPAASQPELLWRLASVPYLSEIPGDIRPTRMIIAAIAALPRHFRAMPLWAAQHAKNTAEDNPLNVVPYIQSCLSIMWQSRCLPAEDRF